MKSAVTISFVPEARGGPFVFWDQPPDYFDGACKTAKRLGFDGVELFPPHAFDGGNRDIVRERIDDAGLKLAAVGTGAGWVKHKLTLTSPDAEVRRQARDFVRSMIEFAGGLDAPVIIGSMQGRWGDGTIKDVALDWLRDALNELGEHARQFETVLIYEPLNRYETNLVNTLEQGVELLSSLATTNVRLLADLFHMNLEERSLPKAIVAAGKHIGHVHLADSNRRPAGYGHTDFEPIGEALRELGFAGYVSAECFPHPDSATAAEATKDAFNYYFRS